MSQSLYWNILTNSLPLAISFIFEAVIENINMHYATSNQMMAGIGIATILVHCVGGSLTHGFNCAYTNFASRSFGAQNLRKFKQTFIQGLTNLGILLSLFVVLAFSSYKIVKWTGQTEAIAQYSYLTMVYHLPGFCFYYISDFFWSYLNSQKVFKPIVGIFCVGLSTHCILSHFISKQYGFNGIIISTNISFFVIMISTFFVVYHYG